MTPLGPPTPPSPRDETIDADRLAERVRLNSWIESFQAGGDHEGSFRSIFQRYHRTVLNFFRRKGLSQEECLDLTQETFLGIYKGLARYRPEARFETWLFQIATNAHLKWLRARATIKRSADEVATEELAEEGREVESREEDPLTEMLDDERRQMLRQAIDELPDQMRLCLNLRIYQQLGYREVAKVLHVSVDTVKSHLFQGRKRLRERMQSIAQRS